MLTNLKKVILNSVTKWGLSIYLFHSVLQLGVHSGFVAGNKPDNYDQFKIAENIGQYFNYLSQEVINRSSEVDRVIPLQEALSLLGYNIGSCGSDGIFGDDVEAAVSFFQDENNLFATGEANPKTLRRLKELVTADRGVEAQLDKTLLQPYDMEKTKNLVNNLPKIMDKIDWSLFFNPDTGWSAIYEVVANKSRHDAASVAFPGCANNHLRDGFRHSETMFNIARNSLVSGADLAVRIGDEREKRVFHTLPLFLMDIYNHRAAIDVYKERKQAGVDMTDTANIFVEEIKKGRFALYPFPLVPKNSL